MMTVIAWSLNLSLGCARVRVEAPKDPIKLDITMRLDVYQHVQNDINAIEDIVSGGAPKQPAAGMQQGFLSVLVSEAYAQDAVSQATQEAALRRRDRLEEVKALLKTGIVGENRSGFLSIRHEENVSALLTIVDAENNDRMTIYKEVAAKNGTSVEAVQKLYAGRLQNDAPAGTPIETEDGAGVFSWKVK
jgi:uncharacterized protein YdbL (DUF1318 family)